MGCTSSKNARGDGRQPLTTNQKAVKTSLSINSAAHEPAAAANVVPEMETAVTQPRAELMATKSKGPPAPRPGKIGAKTYEVDGESFQYEGAPVPDDEEARVAKLRALKVLDTDAEERFDHITKTLATLFKAPIALVSLVDADRQWFKAKVGLDACSTDRNSSFCAWTLLPHAPEVLVVEDAEQDTRFEANPLVKGDPKIRFYAGAPLITADGTRLGSLCVIDTKPRKFTQEQAQVLTNFSEIVVREIERDDLAKHKAQEATKSREAAEGDGMDRLRRALDALSEALVLVDASQPGWPVVYSNIEWHTLVGLKGHENASLWDFILPVPTAGQPKAKCEGDFAEAVQARQVFSLSGRVRKRGSVPGDELHVSCRFKPAEESMDINAVARPPPLPGTGGSTLNKNPLTGYAGESNEIDDLVPVGDADWSSHVLYFVTVVPEKPISSTTYAMGSAAGAMASGAAVGSATKSTQIKAPVAPFVDVRLGRLIGQGGYGQVYRGLWDGAPVAVKIMRHPAPEDASETEIRTQFEAMLSVNVAHPNLVQSFKFSSRAMADDPGTWETWMVQEFCDMGNLQEACDKQKFLLPDKTPDFPIIVSVMREIAGAVSHLHHRGIIHGDLSANNVMLTGRERSRKGFTAKVGDFGLSHVIMDINEAIKLDRFGTPTHMPPEVLKDGMLVSKCDVWSFGVILWQMWTCQRPWAGMSPQQVVAAVGLDGRKIAAPDDMPSDVRSLFLSCLETDHEKRPSFDEILNKVMDMERRIKRTAKQQKKEDAQAEAFLNGE